MMTITWQWESAGCEEYPVFELGRIFRDGESLGTATVRTRRAGYEIPEGEEFVGEAGVRVQPGIWLTADFFGSDPGELKERMEAELTTLLRRALGEEKND